MHKLNQEQLKAVEHIGSPLLIVAGAGTGKTTVITQKIGWLVEQELAKSNEILALTFTEKAAGEMEDRVDKLMPYGYVDMWIMTFHGFCEKILQQHGLDIGLPTNFKLLNEFGQWALIRKNLDNFDLNYYRPLGNQTKFISALLKHFSRAKDENISPQDYLDYADELKENIDNMLSGGNKVKSQKLKVKSDDDTTLKILGLTNFEGEMTKEIAEQEIARINEIANAYHVYQNLLLENSSLDFGDLINYTLLLFRKRSAVLVKFQKQFKYMLVDEFQDTNWAQYELIKMLSPQGKNLTVVGDDDQSIFRFRGASMSNILQFKKDYADSAEVVLTNNYRSAQNILDTAYEFIKLNNPNRLEVQLSQKSNLAYRQAGVKSQKLDKRLISNINIQGEIEVIQGSNLQDEVKKVVEKIIELKKNDKEATWNDFAILVRANNSAKDFINALEVREMPYIFLASKGLYSRPAIMDIIAYLNLLDNYHESTAMYRILNIPIFNFKHEEIIGFLNLARKKTWSLYETIKYSASFSKESVEQIKFLLNLIEKHTALTKVKKVSEVIYAFLQDSGYLKYLSSPVSALTSSTLWQNEQWVKENMRELNAFLKRVQEFEADSNDASVKGFLAELSLEIESGEDGSLTVDPDAGPEMIKVLTVHAAKGLEYKYVFIVNMVDLRFPTTERKEPIALPDALVKEIVPAGDTHLEEERRLFYVAMTRAKNGLYFSWAQDYGGTRKKKPSRFLQELRIKNYEPCLSAGRLQINNDYDDVKMNNNIVITKPTVQPVNKKPIYELPKFYSYTQLQSYDKCPHQYFHDHVLKIPKPGKHFFSFGQTMHLTLQKFFTILMQSQSALQVDLFGHTKDQEQLKKILTLDTLLKLYEESWINNWYEDKRQKEEYYKKGKEIFKEFFNKNKDNWPKVIGLEQSFKLRIGGHLVYGKIDRVDEIDSAIQIVDYKTGQIKDENKITTDQKYQLLLYQLAAEEIIKKKPANLQFYYLENNSTIDFLGEQKDITKMQEWVMNTIQKIEESIKNNHFPHSSDPCRFCSKTDEVGEFSKL